MKAFLVVASLAFCAPAFAQSSSYSGDENATKAQTPEGNDRSAAGASSRRENDTFTHGESKRCESLSGDEKVQCDKEEATKSQGDSANAASKSEAPSRPERR